MVWITHLRMTGNATRHCDGSSHWHNSRGRIRLERGTKSRILIVRHQTALRSSSCLALSLLYDGDVFVQRFFGVDRTLSGLLIPPIGWLHLVEAAGDLTFKLGQVVITLNVWGVIIFNNHHFGSSDCSLRFVVLTRHWHSVFWGFLRVDKGTVATSLWRVGYIRGFTAWLVDPFKLIDLWGVDLRFSVFFEPRLVLRDDSHLGLHHRAFELIVIWLALALHESLGDVPIKLHIECLCALG